YCTSPLCVPARLSFVAGRYISRCSAWGNHNRLASDDCPSLPRVLAEAGYRSYLGGKMHFDATHRYGYEELYPSPFNREWMTGKGGRRAADDRESRGQAWQSRVKDFRVGEHS